MGELVTIRDLTFTYRNSKKPALSDANLEVGRGEIVAIAGPSGCGKSTLLRTINGLIPHMYPGALDGYVEVDGLEPLKTPISELARRVGYVFQNPENQIFMFSVERDIAFGLENLGLDRETIRKRVDWAQEKLKIAHLAHRAPHELSDGQKQRVAIAGALAMQPSLVILDEPTSLLDPYTALDLMGLIKSLRDELGITVIIVEHRLDLLARIATRLVVMHEGRIVLDGAPEKVLMSKEASLASISIPVIARLHALLEEGGLRLGEASISVEGLAQKLKAVIHDRVR